MNKQHIVLAALVALAAAGLQVAFAQVAEPSTVVTVPYGEWIYDFGQNWLLPVVIAAVGWALRKLPKEWQGLALAARVDQLLANAIQYGINATSGAVRTKTLDVETGNAVMHIALQYAIQHGPSIVKSAGGVTRIQEKILARLSLDENAVVQPPVAIAAKAK